VISDRFPRARGFWGRPRSASSAVAGPAKPGGEDFENFEPPQVGRGGFERISSPHKPGGENFENFEPPQVSGGLRPARHSWFGFQNLPKSSGPPPEMFIFFYFGAISLLHTCEKCKFCHFPGFFGPLFFHFWNIVAQMFTRPSFRHSDEEKLARREIVVSLERYATISSQRNKNRVESADLAL